MAINRREFLGLALVAAWPGHAAAARPRPLYLTARRDGAGGYRVSAFDAGGAERFDLALPERAHGMTTHPSAPLAVWFARRPGRHAWLVDLAQGRIVRQIAAAPGRHFYGHGAFAADGGRLFATENDYDAGRGVIGIYDPANDYRRIGEWDSGGIGPHEMRRLGDGNLVVANGGLRTHPDLPRTILNLPTMAPNLAYLDASDGRVLETVRLAPEQHRLGIRHLGQRADDTVAMALQNAGPTQTDVPLLALHRRGQALQLLPMPGHLSVAMRGYMGSVAFDAGGTLLAATSPRGNCLAVWDADSLRHLLTVPMTDVCGLAPLPTPGRFLATSGTGAGIVLDAVTGRTEPLNLADFGPGQWDNHAIGPVGTRA